EKLISFFKNKEKELEILINNLNQQSALQNFEEAQKLKNFKTIFENYIEFDNFISNILNLDTEIINLLKDSNIEISQDKINLKLDLLDENDIFLKFDDKNYTEINYFNELQLILRFIRNKEPYTISK
ncbi:MAG: hypothetical protein ACJ0GA_01230, partial [Candidatus Actinomarina sp.]